MIARRAALLVLACILLCGCGSGKVPVSGRVTYKGQPLADATVMFHGESTHATAHAITDDKGEFMLTSREDDDGVLPGSYKVTVGKYNKVARQPISAEEYAKMAKAEAMKKSFGLAESLVPPQYGNPSRTPLRVEVPRGGISTVELQLSDKP